MSVFASNCLDGKRILVTGASSGIGRALAVQISHHGSKVILSGRNAERLQQTYQLLTGNDHSVSAFNMTDADGTADWVKSLQNSYGPLDGIFHAAGLELVRPAKLVKNEHLNNIFGSSVYSSFGIARAAASKDILRDGASVVFMSSVAGSRGQAGMTAYSASKSAIDALVRSLACELASRRIRVNSIASGAVTTEMHDRLLKTTSQEGSNEYESKHLLGFGNPEDVTSSAVFLLTDAARWITGTTMVVDGGYMVR